MKKCFFILIFFGPYIYGYLPGIGIPTYDMREFIHFFFACFTCNYGNYHEFDHKLEQESFTLAHNCIMPIQKNVLNKQSEQQNSTTEYNHNLILNDQRVLQELLYLKHMQSQ
jgi:hypothetical protein